MHYFQQLDITDCGAACISMIASHFGKRLSIAEVRGNAGTDIIGTNINGLLMAAKKYGIKGTAVKGSREAISPKIPVPFIAHAHIQRDEENWVDHYVVVKKIGKKKIEIWDPDPLYKKQKITYEKFFEWWTGYAVFFEPAADFKKSDKKDSLLLKFIPVFLPHTKTLAFSFLSYAHGGNPACDVDSECGGNGAERPAFPFFIQNRFAAELFVSCAHFQPSSLVF